MRSHLRGAVGLTAGLVVLALAMPGIARAEAENTLLGIRLGESYKQVLHKYGPPKYLQLSEFDQQELINREQGQGGGSANSSGGMSSGMSMGAGKGGAMAGAISASNPYSGMSGGPMMGPISGEGGSSGATRTEGSPSGSNDVVWGQPSATGTVWIYNLPQHTFFFKFDKHGNVIEIQSFGRKAQSRSAKGVALGASLETMLRRYGWARNFTAPSSIPADMKKTVRDTMTFEYRGTGGTKVRFYLSQVENTTSAQVIGIAVGR